MMSVFIYLRIRTVCRPGTRGIHRESNVELWLIFVVGGVGRTYISVAPVAYQVILEPGICQFREFESPRVHTCSYKFVGIFSRAQTDLRKARERELATTTLEEKSTSSGIAEPYAR